LPHAELENLSTRRLLVVAERLTGAAASTPRAGGLTEAARAILEHLEDGEVVQHELALRLMVTPQTLSAGLDRLEARGLVERERDTDDRRRVLVRATRAGRAMLAGAAGQPDPAGLAGPEEEELRRGLIALIRRVATERQGSAHDTKGVVDQSVREDQWPRHEPSR
jgi:DNA-binding MarR family transcriptional regulator